MPSKLSVYDGRDLLGVVSGDQRDWEAFRSNGVRIGSHKSRKAALAAVNRQAREARNKEGRFRAGERDG
jgi:hypothetical protein